MSHLPLAPQEARTEPRRAIAMESSVCQTSDKPGVLVVDDDNLVLVMLQLGLERHGFNVWSAHNGLEAIRLFRNHRGQIAVALLDVSLPGMDGPATCDALRKVDPDLRVCFMSGDMDGYRAEELVQRESVQLIAKPFLINELADMLKHLANQPSVYRAGTGATCEGSHRS